MFLRICPLSVFDNLLRSRCSLLKAQSTHFFVFFSACTPSALDDIFLGLVLVTTPSSLPLRSLHELRKFGDDKVVIFSQFTSFLNVLKVPVILGGVGGVGDGVGWLC